MNKQRKRTVDEHGRLLEAKFTDNASALRFIDQHKGDFRYVYSWNKWLAWDGRRWSLRQGDNRVGDKARLHASNAWTEASMACETANPLAEEIVRFAKQANRKERIRAVIDLAAYDQRIAIHHDELDNDPYLLNVLNGTLDLKSMQFRDHQREDNLTQVADVRYEQSAECPLWLQTLDYIFAKDQQLINYAQSLCGYSLAGTIGEHILPILWGEGRNGKSTFVGTIADILGDYSALVSQDLLMPNKHQAHPTEMADLFAKRFVHVSEPEQGRHLAEAKIKSMTGDRILKARRMREDYWEFDQTHTFFIATNHKPKVKGTDTGIWRRLKLIPFVVDLAEVVEVDNDFPDKLKAEHSGILNWMIDGWAAYQESGLTEPDAVIEATAEYRSHEDVVGQFIAEFLIEDPDGFVGATSCFEAFKEATGSKMSQREFGDEMNRRHFEKGRERIAGSKNKTTIYRGIKHVL